MKYQRINTTTTPPTRVAPPSDPRVGRRTIWDDELHGPLPNLSDGEAWAEIHDRPEAGTGYDPDTQRIERVISEVEGTWRDGWRVVDLTDEEVAARNRPQPVTKLTLMNRLVALGKWDTFKAVLAQAPAIVQDAWTLAQDIRADDPLFVANREGFRAALGLTEEEFDNLLTPSES